MGAWLDCDPNESFIRRIEYVKDKRASWLSGLERHSQRERQRHREVGLEASLETSGCCRDSADTANHSFVFCKQFPNGKCPSRRRIWSFLCILIDHLSTPPDDPAIDPSLNHPQWRASSLPSSSGPPSALPPRASLALASRPAPSPSHHAARALPSMWYVRLFPSAPFQLWIVRVVM